MSFVHQALLYSSDREFLDVTTPFIANGILAGDDVVAVTTGHNIALLTESVGWSDRLEYIDADSWYTTPGSTHTAYFQRAADYRGPGRLRVIGEPVWTGRRAHEILEWKRYESVLNATLTATAAWVLCPYDTRVLPSDVTADAARTHPAFLGEAGPVPSEAYIEPVEFGRECDRMFLAEPMGHLQRASLHRQGIRGIRALAGRTARTLGLDELRRDRFVTAVHEILSVLQSAGVEGEVLLWTDGLDLIVDISAAGTPIRSPHSGYVRPEFELSEPAPDVSLWLARSLCDYVEMRTGDRGTVVRLRMQLPAIDHRRVAGGSIR